MAKISINLLPPEIITREIKKTKFYKVQAIGVAIILVMVFLASLTMALRILQSQNITEVQAKLGQAEQRVSNLKSTQVSLAVLKNRLTVINQYLGVPSKQASLYKIIDKLIPDNVVMSAINISKTNEITLLALAPDPVSLDTFVSNLSEKEMNEGSFSNVSVESLNRGKDGFYRISLKIEPK